MHMLKGGEPMATQTRHTALIVDDSEISREILKNIFSAHYAIEEARDGEEGLQKTDNQKIFVGSPIQLNKDTFFDHLATLKKIAYSNNSENLVQALIDLVPTFHHKPRQAS